MEHITFWHPTPNKAISSQTCTGSATPLLRSAPNLMNGAIENLIEYLPDHEILLCKQCKVAVPSDNLEIHLRSSYRGIKKPWRDSIYEKFEQAPTAKTTADMHPLLDNSSPFSFLIPPREGYRCPCCPIYRSLYETKLRRHSSKVHNRKIKLSEIKKHMYYL